jgi:hypothetical protein
MEGEKREGGGQEGEESEREREDQCLLGQHIKLTL